MQKKLTRTAVTCVLTIALIVTAIPFAVDFSARLDAGASTSGSSGVSFMERIESSFTADAAAKKITVKFDANGGEVTKESATYKAGSKFKNLPKPKRANYEFKGWYTKKKGGKKIANGKKVTFKKTTTLYAHWSAVKVSASVRSLLGKTFKQITEIEGELEYINPAGKYFGDTAAVESDAPLYRGVTDYYEFKCKNKSAKDKDKCIAVHTTSGALFPKVTKEISCEKLAKHIGGTYKGYETSAKSKNSAQYYHFFKYKNYGIIIDYYSSNKEKDRIPTEGAMCVIYKQ
ncbi:MAG: InlB B-repeat-containing protein [Clostridiales Family XIII bacterium]|jgi:uncharacterized repeat protein (TIGR02543 family)|nr:InlB B-repeat-containing protein [Clostridiales Family XIII bacterium]